MTSVFDREDILFQVVVNHEEQYSIWPDYKAVPQGWRTVGKSGLKKECLAYIEETWTDMRPLSLRQKMEGQTAAQYALGQKTTPLYWKQSAGLFIALDLCGPGWPLREQARSHMGIVNDTEPMWERACSRRTITRSG
ncbi:hypothetical protein PS624_03803 [Pseudomonas fluorescens]|uniref:MbtH-like domain-containing protein n=2 Tax=Pseudomonas TaxID=286 RepID=A0A5E6UYG9_PSEFL|nr:hypothetical protein PS624_03803 [Pseudomonas fluorescens]